jgi:hypothetical protein
MAQISISISSEYESRFEIQDYEPGNGLLSVLIHTNLPGDGENRRNPYAHDWVHIHGTDADLREFARKISAALEESDKREESEESAHELDEQNETGAMRCPPRE